MRARLTRAHQRWSLAGGACTAVAALVPPLHDLSERLLSAHMVQHELLMVVAAPLLVLGRPFVASLRAIPREPRLLIARFVRRPAVRRVSTWISQPFIAWLVHAIAIWCWHMPSLFDLAVRNDVIHVIQHAAFFGTALLFWSTIIHPARRSQRGALVISLFTTAIHTALLGALMTFARSPWYSVYADAAGSLSSLADQQLAGMIMWIPASLAYLIAALLVMRRWLADADAESSRVQPQLVFGTTRPS